jgi:hypothetical protein
MKGIIILLSAMLFMSFGSEAQVRVLANTSTYTDFEIQLPQVQKTKLKRSECYTMVIRTASRCIEIYAACSFARQ